MRCDRDIRRFRFYSLNYSQPMRSFRRCRKQTNKNPQNKTIEEKRKNSKNQNFDVKTCQLCNSLPMYLSIKSTVEYHFALTLLQKWEKSTKWFDLKSSRKRKTAERLIWFRCHPPNMLRKLIGSMAVAAFIYSH